MAFKTSPVRRYSIHSHPLKFEALEAPLHGRRNSIFPMIPAVLRNCTIAPVVILLFGYAPLYIRLQESPPTSLPSLGPAQTLQKMPRRSTEIQVAIQGGHWRINGSIWDHRYFIGADIYTRKDTYMHKHRKMLHESHLITPNRGLTHKKRRQ